MPHIIVSEEEARNILYGEVEDSKVIQDTIEGNSRWAIDHELIVQYKGKYYKTWYSVGATECQDQRPFEYEKEVKLIEVEQVEVTVKVWQNVEDKNEN